MNEHVEHPPSRKLLALFDNLGVCRAVSTIGWEGSPVDWAKRQAGVQQIANGRLVIATVNLEMKLLDGDVVSDARRE